MATTVQVIGKCQILVNTGAQYALEELGYSEAGVEIRFERKYVPVHSDENGGPDGIPLDYQDFGYMHNVSFTLVNFDIAIWKKLSSGQYGGTHGSNGYIGTLLSTKRYRLLLRPLNPDGITPGVYTVNAAEVRNYIGAMPLDTIDWTIAQKYLRAPMAWKCLPVGSVMFNTVNV
jgi:hypothetical protein